jgi:hypothetical protein
MSLIQSVIIHKDAYKNLREAKQWLNRHGFKSNVDTKKNTWRFRQIDPKKVNVLGSKKINKYLTFIICKYK